MIFVTVGTHEQPFNRLIQKVDELKCDGIIKDDVIIQTGFSTYEPKYCQWSKLIPYQQMVKNVADARIVITHGGPASFIMPLQIGKTPIVVPRQHQFNEHVNDHQVEFARNVAQRMGTIIPVEDINTLGDVIMNYDQIVAGMGHGMSSNNAKFNEELENLVNELYCGENIEYWTNRKYYVNYLMTDHMFDIAYKERSKIRNMVDSVRCGNNECLTINRKYDQPVNRGEAEAFLEKQYLHKLSWKWWGRDSDAILVLKTSKGEQTWLGYLLENFCKED